MICKVCGKPSVVWIGPLTNLEGTECLMCGAKNSQFQDDVEEYGDSTKLLLKIWIDLYVHGCSWCNSHTKLFLFRKLWLLLKIWIGSVSCTIYGYKKNLRNKNNPPPLP